MSQRRKHGPGCSQLAPLHPPSQRRSWRAWTSSCSQGDAEGCGSRRALESGHENGAELQPLTGMLMGLVYLESSSSHLRFDTLKGRSLVLASASCLSRPALAVMSCCCFPPVISTCGGPRWHCESPRFYLNELQTQTPPFFTLERLFPKCHERAGAGKLHGHVCIRLHSRFLP